MKICKLCGRDEKKVFFRPTNKTTCVLCLREKNKGKKKKPKPMPHIDSGCRFTIPFRKGS